MRTRITDVTLQINENFKSKTVFTTYQNEGQEPYDGFTPYPTLEEANKAATLMTGTCNNDFISDVKGYNQKLFKLSGLRVDSFITTKQ